MVVDSVENQFAALLVPASKLRMLSEQVVHVQLGFPFVVHNFRIHPNVTMLIKGERLAVHVVPPLAGAVGICTHSLQNALGIVVVEVDRNWVTSHLVAYVEVLEKQEEEVGARLQQLLEL